MAGRWAAARRDGAGWAAGRDGAGGASGGAPGPGAPETTPASCGPGAGTAGRARRHAALGEPLRLAIVDHLALGDASPGELCALVDLPSNLLAHHLKVLEEAGLVRRGRSEGDRRRSYVALCRDDAEVDRLLRASVRPEARPVPRVVFVCTRNSARSQLAAAVWGRTSRIPASSAGTRPAEGVHPLALETGGRHGLRMARARTREVGATVRPGDLVVAVCDAAHERLATAGPAVAPVLPGRAWLHWSVPDPAPAGTLEAFEAAYQDIVHRVDRLAVAVAG